MARFRLIVDLRDYEPGDIAAHKEMRVVVPLTLVAHGYRTVLLDLFDPVDLPVTSARDVICVAVAHVHHDASKMDEYQARLGRERERFFTSYAAAATWLAGIVLTGKGAG